jgi:hypothetical protein
VDKINYAFSSVTQHIVPLQPSPEFNEPEFVSTFTISEDKVYKKLSCLQPFKSPGPDDLPNWMFKLYALFLATPVASIYNESIRQACDFLKQKKV